MNATKHARVCYLSDSSRETRKRPCTRSYVRGHCESCAVPEFLTQYECGRATDRRMAGWILGMCWGSGKPGNPGRVGIYAPRVTNGRDRAPEHISIFAVPARNSCVGNGDIHQREQMRVLRQSQRPRGGNL